MAEIRLIDGNELRGIESLLNTDIIQSSKEASWLLSQVLYDVDAMTTIDPETLPIVRELRAKISSLNAGIENLSYVAKKAYEQRDDIKNELERVTAERDAAVSDLENIMAYNSDTCQLCKNKQCYVRGGTKPCLPKWRGPDGDHP